MVCKAGPILRQGPQNQPGVPVLAGCRLSLREAELGRNNLPETEAPAGIEMFAHGHMDGLWQGCNLHLLLLFSHKVLSGSLQPQGL